jgi:hypothetical protein
LQYARLVLGGADDLTLETFRETYNLSAPTESDPPSLAYSIYANNFEPLVEKIKQEREGQGEALDKINARQSLKPLRGAFDKWHEFTVEEASLERASGHYARSTMARAMTGWKEVTDKAREDTRKTYKEVLLRQKQEAAAAAVEDVVLEVVGDLARSVVVEELSAAQAEAERIQKVQAEAKAREAELRAAQEALAAREAALRAAEQKAAQEAKADAKGARRRRRRRGGKKGVAGIAAAGGPKVKDSDLDAWLDAQVEANKGAIAKHAAEQEALRKAEAERQAAEEEARRLAAAEEEAKKLAEEKARMEADIETARKSPNDIANAHITVAAWNKVCGWALKGDENLNPEPILFAEAAETRDMVHVFSFAESTRMSMGDEYYINLLKRATRHEAALELPAKDRVCTVSLANISYEHGWFDVAAGLFSSLDAIDTTACGEFKFPYARCAYLGSKEVVATNKEQAFELQKAAIEEASNVPKKEKKIAVTLVAEIVKGLDSVDDPSYREGWREEAPEVAAAVEVLGVGKGGTVVSASGGGDDLSPGDAAVLNYVIGGADVLKFADGRTVDLTAVQRLATQREKGGGAAIGK